MCDAHIIESVKQRLLSRRNAIQAIAAGPVIGTGAGAAAAMTPITPITPAMTAGQAPVDHPNGTNAHNVLAHRILTNGACAITDMTHTLDADFPTFSGTPSFAEHNQFTYAKDGYNLKVLTIDEHIGTHIDAPLHFSEHAHAVDEIPPKSLFNPLVVVDIRAKANTNPDAELTPDDITTWQKQYGDLPQGCCVALLSGWARYSKGGKFRNADAQGVMHFPGFHIETINMLLENNAVVGVATDTLSFDCGQSTDFAAHYAWLPSGRWALEALDNLDKVPVFGAMLVVGAPKHRGGTGGPSRVFALSPFA